MPEPGLRRVLEHPRTKAVDNPGRDETEQERDDRNVLELLQELRVGRARSSGAFRLFALAPVLRGPI